MAEGDVFGARADHLELGHLRLVLAHVGPAPGVEHVRVRVDLLVVVDGVHRDRDLGALRDERPVREGVVLHRGAPQRLCGRGRAADQRGRAGRGERGEGRRRRRTGSERAVPLRLAEEAVDLDHLVDRVLRPPLRLGDRLGLLAQRLLPLGMRREVEHRVRERLSGSGADQAGKRAAPRGTYHAGCVDRRDVDGHHADDKAVNEELFALRLVHDPLEHVVLSIESTTGMQRIREEISRACLATPCRTAS